MTLVPMRFKNYEWRYNPEEISFECEKNIQELNSPKNTAYIQSKNGLVDKCPKQKRTFVHQR